MKEKVCLDNIDDNTGEVGKLKTIELVIKNNIPAKFEFNFLEIKEILESYSEKYKDLIVTEENLKDMIAVKNEMGRVEKNIDKFRLANKREMEKPIREFENQCKELIGVVKEVNNPIREQIQKYEDMRKQQKEEEVNNLILQVIEKYQLKEKYASQLTITSKYLNKGQKLKDTIKDLEQRAEALKNYQVQEEENERLRKEKTDLLQKTIDTKNKTHGMNLKISDYMYLLDRSITEIIEEIEKVPVPLKEEIKETPIEKVEEVKEVAPLEEKEIKKETYNFTLEINNCNLEKSKLLKEFLENNNFEYRCIKK